MLETLAALIDGARIGVAPIAPWPVAAVVAVAALAFFAWGRSRRARGGGWRLLAGLIAVAALLQPSLLAEDREQLDDVVSVIIDESASQSAAGRLDETRAAAEALVTRLEALGGLEVRRVVVGPTDDGRPRDETRLVEALDRSLADAPRDRFAGAVLVTDGRVHDIDDDRLQGFGAPVHGIVAGRADEGDRVLKVERAPGFAIVGEPVSISVRVEDQGAGGVRGALATVIMRVDGVATGAWDVAVGMTEELPLELEHGGENIVELEVAPGPKELTLQNNRAALAVSGVRDRLRVLLVSGEPHPGERAWRNLLKADPSVDLVHFTILRPPEKQDGTPIRELSLIAFPTRELFSIKLAEFDLVIFDRYRRRGVLPEIYLSNVARYVEEGGAVLTASGPEFATSESLYRSSLSQLLPATPSPEVLEQPFRPRVTDIGGRHPITAGLVGANSGVSDEPLWGRWYRIVDTEYRGDRALMSGPSERPLLVAEHHGRGRVAQLMSDQGWLWARGHDGGGPQAELLRRLAHWLMKEPDLEEEDLRARIVGGTLAITRRTLGDAPPPATVETPDGRAEVAPFVATEAPGVFTATLPAEALGLYRVANGDLRALAAAGPLAPRELAEVVATTEALADPLGVTGGVAVRLSDTPAPEVRRVRDGRATGGDGWLGFVRRDAYVVRDVRETPLAPPILALLAMAGALMMAWRSEGR